MPSYMSIKRGFKRSLNNARIVVAPIHNHKANSSEIMRDFVNIVMPHFGAREMIQETRNLHKNSLLYIINNLPRDVGKISVKIW